MRCGQRLIGLGDRTSLSLFNTLDGASSDLLPAAHEFALGSDGLRAGASVLDRPQQSGPGGRAFEKPITQVFEGPLTYAFLRPSISRCGGTADRGHRPGAGLRRHAAHGTSCGWSTPARSRIDRSPQPCAARAASRNASQLVPAPTPFRFELRHGLSRAGASSDWPPAGRLPAAQRSDQQLAADTQILCGPLRGDTRSPAGAVAYRRGPAAGAVFGRAAAVLRAGQPRQLHDRPRLRPGTQLGDHATGLAVELRYGILFPREADAFAFEPFAFSTLAAPGPTTAAPRPSTPRPSAPAPACAPLGATGPISQQRWPCRSNAPGSRHSKGDVRLLFTLTTRLRPWGDL